MLERDTNRCIISSRMPDGMTRRYCDWPGTRARCDGTTRCCRRLDHRRHWDSEEGAPFGRRSPAVLWSTGKAGQLSGSCQSHLSQRSRERTGRVSTVSAGDLGERLENVTAAGIPKTIQFQTKWQIALDMIDSVRAEELPPAPVLADAGYGIVTAFRDALSQRQIPYVVGIGGETTVWPPGMEPLPPKQTGKAARHPDSDAAQPTACASSGVCKTRSREPVEGYLLEGRNTRKDDFSVFLAAGSACS